MTGTTTRIIKRYANRKLYDTRDSRYVTLEQISEMIRNGEDVKVVDNSTKEDLTSVTLAQIIFEEEKRKKSFLPLGALRKIIQTGGESLHELMNQLNLSAQRVGQVFRREDKEQGPEAAAEPAPTSAKSAERLEAGRFLKEFVDGVQTTLDEWQTRIDQNIHSAIDSVSPLAPLQKEITVLQERIADLERRLRGDGESGGSSSS
ncbi:MAG: polyhydroxyalkanoate synthesis regulator DNA-binding domain-containing protein [Deltaproteobacteria bacterium]|nr:polyhydroxyalkanoate synthesis regulator DNA-binding domain-containing protein [Deltaproteobacteria bacterium]